MALVLWSFNRPVCTETSVGITDRVLSQQTWKFFAMHLVVAGIYGVSELAELLILNKDVKKL